MYQFDSKVRYSEVDANRELTWSALLNYFQDCSVFQSESLGRGIEYLAKNHQAWILSSWQICLNRMPKLAERITVSTWPYEMKAFYGYRNFCMDAEDGTRLAYANSMWVLMDTQSGRPIKVSDEITDAYGMEPALPMERMGRKISIPQDMKEVRSLVVPKDFIDTNQHMNNEKYVMLAMEFLPEGFTVGQLRAEYRREAHLGDTICISVSEQQDTFTVLLAGEDGKPYAVVEMSCNGVG